MKIYISTAERSGFLYGRLLADGLASERPDARIFGRFEDEQGLAPVGFAAGARAMPGVISRLNEIEREVRRLKPDVFLAVAWSEPNIILGLRLGNMRNMRRLFFAPPQLWAWGRWRASLLRRGYHRLYALYPREASVLQSMNLPAYFAGNPLAAHLKTYLGTKRKDPQGGRTIALLPGSRTQERSRHLFLLKGFLKTWRQKYPNDRAVWLFPTAREALEAHELLDNHDRAVGGAERYLELAQAHLALVASGTASLETALVGTPQVVFYCLAGFEVALARALTGVERFALPNLVFGEDAVPELLNPSLVKLVEAAESEALRTRESTAFAARLYKELTPLDNASTFLSMS